MKQSQKYLKYANLCLLLIGSTIAIIDILSFVLLFVSDVLKSDVFVGWFRFYPILTHYIFPISLIGIVVTLGGYFAIIIVFAWLTKEKPDMKFGSMSISIVVFVNVLLCPCSFAWLLLSPNYSVLQSTTLDNRVYHLHVTTYDAAENQFFYHISECDRFDFICKEIYSDEQYWIEQKVGFFEQGTEKLIADAIAHTIILQINDEAVYVYQVK